MTLKEKIDFLIELCAQGLDEHKKHDEWLDGYKIGVRDGCVAMAREILKEWKACSSPITIPEGVGTFDYILAVRKPIFDKLDAWRKEVGE